MSLIQKWNQLWDKYMRNTAEIVDETEFIEDELRRYVIVFSGLVQGVGFRYEVYQLAQKLGLTGFVKNMPDETVYAEIEGPKNKILFLIEQMKSIPRIHISNVCIDEMPMLNDTVFEIAN